MEDWFADLIGEKAESAKANVPALGAAAARAGGMLDGIPPVGGVGAGGSLLASIPPVGGIPGANATATTSATGAGVNSFLASVPPVGQAPAVPPYAPARTARPPAARPPPERTTPATATPAPKPAPTRTAPPPAVVVLSPAPTLAPGAAPSNAERPHGGVTDWQPQSQPPVEGVAPMPRGLQTPKPVEQHAETLRAPKPVEQHAETLRAAKPVEQTAEALRAVKPAGVYSPATNAAPAPAQRHAPAKASHPTEVELRVDNLGRNPEAVITAVADLLNIKAKQARKLLRNLPTVVARQVPYEQATQAIAALRQAGADARLSSDQAHAPAHPPAAAPGATLILQQAGERKISVIKIIRDFTGLGLSEGKALVDAVPSPIGHGLTPEAAAELARQLRAIGATVTEAR